MGLWAFLIGTIEGRSGTAPEASFQKGDMRYMGTRFIQGFQSCKESRHRDEAAFGRTTGIQPLADAMARVLEGRATQPSG